MDMGRRENGGGGGDAMTHRRSRQGEGEGAGRRLILSPQATFFHPYTIMS
jgi:hypothetical protein